MRPVCDFENDNIEARENPKTVTIDVPVTFPEPLFVKLKAWSEHNGTTVPQMLSEYFPVFY